MINKNQSAEEVSEELFPIVLTNKAIKMAKYALQNLDKTKDETLRISVKGGGCTGLKYTLNFVNKTDCFDLTTNKDGLSLAIDIFSTNHLINTKVDYVESINGNGFKFNNPNAKRTCGCSSSFS